MSDKCTEKLSAMVPDELATQWRQRARQAGCTPSELLRDLICMALHGETFGELVTKDRRAALGLQGRVDGMNRACE